MDYWHKQSLGAPLFPDILWSRPENRVLAGKLAVVGGNLQGFSAPAEAYQTALKAGIGTIKVLLPDAVKKIVGSHIEDAEFAPSTRSGSFAKQSLAHMLELARWSDGVLLAGDFGRNSETAVTLEKFIRSYSRTLVIAKDAGDYLVNTKNILEDREQACTLVLTLAQLQKLGTSLRFHTPFTFGMDLVPLVRGLHDLTLAFPLYIIVKHRLDIVVAAKGQITTTKLNHDQKIWQVRTAASAAVWQLQNPLKPFEALTAAVLELY